MRCKVNKRLRASVADKLIAECGGDRRRVCGLRLFPWAENQLRRKVNIKRKAVSSGGDFSSALFFIS
jgi:hypothetical protein